MANDDAPRTKGSVHKPRLSGFKKAEGVKSYPAYSNGEFQAAHLIPDEAITLGDLKTKLAKLKGQFDVVRFDEGQIIAADLGQLSNEQLKRIDFSGANLVYSKVRNRTTKSGRRFCN